MQKVIRCLIPLLLIGMFACNNAPKGEQAQTGEAQQENNTSTDNANTYKVNTNNSVISWTGSKPTGKHTGTLKLSSGELNASGNGLAGTMVIDMNSLTDVDLESGKGKEKLEGHLKSADFFDVSTYPTATFTITGTQVVTGNPEVTHNVTGNLTIKGITKSITFPANVNVTDNSISAVTPAFTINRTDWDVKYGSGIIGTVADKIIHDDVSLSLSIAAAK